MLIKTVILRYVNENEEKRRKMAELGLKTAESTWPDVKFHLVDFNDEIHLEYHFKTNIEYDSWRGLRFGAIKQLRGAIHYQNSMIEWSNKNEK